MKALSILGFFAALSVLVACGERPREVSFTRSLSGDDFAGKKYYLGWGAVGGGDPDNMHNEVKYDVLHTHDIFTNNVGGNYIGTKESGNNVNRSLITGHWNRLRGLITSSDMFVQYSSGHGSQSGLGIGISYNEIRDNALSYPANEIVIFTMACYSGGLVSSFNSARSRWADWGAQGRSLFVMSSSGADEESSTGPGTDPDQPGGPDGSAGSAFGHSLWKSLIGYADGYLDGVKDGYLSLDEIVEYTKYKTEDIGGHTPQITGVYNERLVMNRVPPRSFLESLEGSSEGISDEDLAASIQALDTSMRLQ